MPSDADRFERLAPLLRAAVEQPHYRDAFAGHDIAAVTDRASLESLPILRKQDFVELQRVRPPFGGLMNASSRPDHLFVSPGPIHEPGFTDPGFWRMHRALEHAGIGANDIVHNTFSYHLTPGAWIFDAGAKALGCSVIPAGSAPIELQLQAIAQYAATAYAGVPDFLKILLDAWRDAHDAPFPIRRALVSGGALTPGLKAIYDDAGIVVLQCYATAELGLIASDVPNAASMRIDDDLIVEIVDPATGRAVPEGAVGEVVVTTLREHYPLIRFGTGDLSSFAPEPHADGAPGLTGWLGRADATLKVRGMFVRPPQLDAIRASVDAIERLQLIVGRENERDTAVLVCGVAADVAAGDTTALARTIAERARATCQVRMDVRIVDAATFDDDADLVVDRR